MRLILLILSSTGCRIGALPSLKLGNLTKIPEHEVYSIVFYEGTNNEYYTFTTRECSLTGIDNYLLYRQRCSEKLLFKGQKWEPEDTPLIRLQFDATDILQASSTTLYSHLIRSGIRQVEHPTESNSNNSHVNRIRKPISLTNGFRKHVISTFIEAGLNHEIRELLVDHATQLDQYYFRPSQEQVLTEYLKAEPLLTIDSTLRLERENKTLRQEVSRFNRLDREIEELKQKIGL